MRKSFFALVTLALLLAGCSKESLGGSTGEESLVKATFTANLNDGAVTRAVADGDGQGTKANRCIMELYYGEDLYYREVQTVSNKVATFSNITLVSNRTYEVLFWADAGEKYYDAADLRAVKMDTTEYKANDDARDAFFYRGQQVVAQKGELYEVELRRPFAQMNIITLDAAGVKSEALYPETVKMVYTAPTQFNIYTGELSKEKEITCSGDVYAKFDAKKTALTLQMDYIFADTAKAMIDIAFNAEHSGDEDVVFAFTNIPYQRNFRTNIQGKLLTTTGNWTATIVPEWSGNGTSDDDNWFVNYIEAGSIAAANEALKTNNAVSIENPNDAKDPIVIPAEQDGKNVFINITGANGSIITIQNAEGANGPANIDIKSDSEDLIINCPNSHVEVNKGEFENVTATTSATTLVVGKDVTIENLTINAGNAKIYGKVDALTRANGVKAEMYASDRATLINYINWAKEGDIVCLDCDIDLKGEKWAPLFVKDNHFAATFDGQGHKISNLTVEDYNGKYIGFISTVSGATIKNVTFEKAKLTNAESNKDARGAVIVGWSYACNIDNCHVINSSVTGFQKVAGILGSMSVEGDAGLNSVTNCSVEDLTLSCNFDNDLFQSGALIGYIQLVNKNPDGVLIENNSVKDITFNRDCSDYGNTGYYNGTFIGTIIRKQKVDGQKIILNNNTILGTNTDVFKTIYSSPYFGWTSNTEEYTGAIAPIVIDGEEWKPVFYMDAQGKYHVTNLDALKYFRDLVNSGKTFENKTVLLDADIDMAGEVWTPTSGVIAYPGTSFYGIFDGQNHTIKNLTCTDNQQNYACAALFGSLYGTVQNLKMTNVNISSSHYAAAIAAYSSSNGSKIINCSVIGGTITSTPEWLGSEYDNGDKAGAIMGYNGEGGTVDGCYVEGVTITAYRDLGAIVGAGVVGNTINNKVKDCILTIDRSKFYGDKDVNANPIVGRNLGGTLNANNTSENVTVSIPANTADALRAAVKSVNAATSAGAYTITIANGTYELSDIAIAENASNKSVTIKAATKGGVTLKMNSDTKSKQIFLVDGYSGNHKTYSLIIDGIKFDLTQVTSGTPSAVYAFMSGDPFATSIGYTTAGPNLRYAHHVTIQNCELVGAQGTENAMMFYSQSGTSPNNIVVQDSKVADAGYLFSGYCDTFTASNVTATNVKHFVNNQGSGITVENCHVDCYTDYAVRANGGPVSITNSAFTMTYAGDEKGGIYVDRGANTQISMSGNTYPASYAGANMHDVYKADNSDCTINGTITLSKGESYDFPRE